MANLERRVRRCELLARATEPSTPKATRDEALGQLEPIGRREGLRNRFGIS